MKEPGKKQVVGRLRLLAADADRRKRESEGMLGIPLDLDLEEVIKRVTGEQMVRGSGSP